MRKLEEELKKYAESGVYPFHMPGHKGKTVLGPEALDITEIPGADVLYRAKGVIRESEENAAALFGSARTLYSTEGSSLCIRAMLQLAQLYARLQGRRPRIAAGRNAHRVFLEGAALLDWEIRWIGCGQDLQWWKEFFSVARMMGYDGYVSLEMEDLTMSVEAGLETSIDALKTTISR